MHWPSSSSDLSELEPQGDLRSDRSTPFSRARLSRRIGIKEPVDHMSFHTVDRYLTYKCQVQSLGRYDMLFKEACRQTWQFLFKQLVSHEFSIICVS